MSCQISANQREVETTANVNKYWNTLTKDNDVFTNVILPISISCQLFHADIQIPEVKLQAPFPFPTPPPECSGELAHRLEYHHVCMYRSPSSHVDNKRSTYMMFPIKIYITLVGIWLQVSESPTTLVFKQWNALSPEPKVIYTNAQPLPLPYWWDFLGGSCVQTLLFM